MSGVQAFNGKPLTAREVMIARQAFEQGAEWMFCTGDAWAAGDSPAECRRSARHARAVQAFPFPLVRRARVLGDGKGGLWRLVGTDLQYAESNKSPTVPHQWCAAGYYVTKERLAIWNNLFANPTEEVEDDGGSPLGERETPSTEEPTPPRSEGRE